MKDLFENLTSYIPLVAMLISAVMWLSSLDSRSNNNQSDIHVLDDEFKSFMQSNNDALNRAEERIARLEAQMDMIAEKVGFDIDRRY